MPVNYIVNLLLLFAMLGWTTNSAVFIIRRQFVMVGINVALSWVVAAILLWRLM